MIRQACPFGRLSTNGWVLRMKIEGPSRLTSYFLVNLEPVAPTVYHDNPVLIVHFNSGRVEKHPFGAEVFDQSALLCHAFRI